MLRAVVDVNVLISALLQAAGKPARILREWDTGRFDLLISPHLVAELDDVLGRPHISRHVSPEDATAFLAAFLDAALVVDDPPAERIVPNDPDDDYLVALALAGGADVIVTGDADLLDADVGVRVMSPREFAALLETLPS